MTATCAQRLSAGPWWVLRVRFLTTRGPPERAISRPRTLSHAVASQHYHWPASGRLAARGFARTRVRSPSARAFLPAHGFSWSCSGTCGDRTWFPGQGTPGFMPERGAGVTARGRPGSVCRVGRGVGSVRTSGCRDWVYIFLS